MPAYGTSMYMGVSASRETEKKKKEDKPRQKKAPGEGGSEVSRTKKETGFPVIGDCKEKTHEKKTGEKRSSNKDTQSVE